MLTIFEALTYAGEQLKEAQKTLRHTVQNPKLDAQVLLSFVLKKPSAYLFAHGDEALTSDSADLFLSLVKRRAAHEPIAYILGEKAFFKRDFLVTSATLIPRPETELIIEHAIAESKPGSVFADIGTGSGAIAVTLAAETGSFVFATDISEDAIVVAKENAKRHGVSERIFFLKGDLISPFLADLKEWLARAELKSMTVIANLPYIPRRAYESLDDEVKNFEPKTALLGGIDGLDIYDRLFSELAKNRAAFPPELRVLLEIDPSQDLSGPRLIKQHFPYAQVTVLNDFSGRARIIDAHV